MIARMTSFPPPMLRIFSLLTINAFKSPSSSKAQRPNKKSDHHPNFFCAQMFIFGGARRKGRLGFENLEPTRRDGH